MLAIDDTFGYAVALLGVAPLASQVGLAPIEWTILFPIIALPCLSLLLTIGRLSNTGPVLTYKRIAPIASGIGWALTWFIGERLYIEGLRGAQNLLYLIFSLRFHLSWAVECGYVYNTDKCFPFARRFNTTDGQLYPNNFWPAQEFNKYVIRNNPKPAVPNISRWEPNEWYLGSSTEAFYLAFPSFGLLIAHVFIWSSIFFAMIKLIRGSQEWFTKLFVFLPIVLYMVLIMGMSISGFHFGLTLNQEISETERDKDPLDFWADIRGLYRTSLLLVDYTGAFTGILLFATSRIRVGAPPLSPIILTLIMMVVPALLTILRAGCEGHVADQQPHYKTYASTDETISFDVLPVCFATSRMGPLWAIFYYTAQLLYTSIGPMIVYGMYIYQSFADEFASIQNKPTIFIAGLVAFFAAPSIFLYMPLGTKIITLFRYVSQASIVHVLTYVIIFLIYGWQTIEENVLSISNEPSSKMLIQYFFRPSSPIYTVLLFSVIPMLLCSKFSAVFDLLTIGNDIKKHIDTGALFIPVPLAIKRLIGYGVMFAPLFIIAATSSYILYIFLIRHKLGFQEVFKPSPEWMSHSVVNNPRPRIDSFAHCIYDSLFNPDYQVLLFGIIVIESIMAIILFFLFSFNALAGVGILSYSAAANDYRTFMLFIFVFLHIWSLIEMRHTKAHWDSPNKMSIYIGVATMETAVLNGYMWMFTTDHSWGIDSGPLLVILCTMIIRGTLISAAIAIRAHLREIARPTRTRDATEIYDVDMGIEVDAEDESPVIFDLARA